MIVNTMLYYIAGLPKVVKKANCGNINKILKKISIPDEAVADAKEISGSATSSTFLVRFFNQRTRTEVLEKKRGIVLTRKEYSIDNSDQKIFINEDLNKDTSELFKQARNLHTSGFKYVWVKNGNIYVRKDDGIKPIKINNADDLKPLFNAK